MRRASNGRRWFWIAAGTGAYAAHALLGGDSSIVENVYSRGIFVGLRWFWDHTLGLSPVPLVYVLVAGVFAWVVCRTLRRQTARRAIVKRPVIDQRPVTPGQGARKTWRSFAATLGRGVLFTGGLLGLLVFLFYALWGFNYGRIGLEKQIGLDAAAIDLAMVKAEAGTTARALAEERALIPGASSAVLTGSVLATKLESEIRRVLVKALSDLGYPVAGRPRVRPLWPGGWLMRFASTGFYFPYCGEGYIAANLTPAEKPFVIAHEMVHVYGIADEGAANFLGFLACGSSTDPSVRYSGQLAYWEYVFPELAKVSPDDAKELAVRLPPGVRADLRAIYENWARYRGRLQQTAQRVYGQYLKSQGVAEGLKSYDRFVSLVVAWHRRESRRAGPQSGRGPGPPVRGDLLEIEDLPVMRSGIQTRQFCTYDRAGDNYDWNYFVLYTEPNGEVVIFDATGPGCLYRQQMNVWRSMDMFHSDVKDVRIRYYFDDEEKPRVDMDISVFFSEKNPLGIFREPLAMSGGDDFRTTYCPMPFKKRLKIALNREPGGPGSRLMPWTGPAGQVPSPRPHWCHFTYHIYREDPGLTSWKPGDPSGELASLWAPENRGKDPKSESGNLEIAKAVRLAAGETVCLADIDGAGSIASVRVSVDPLDEEALFGTWIRMTWDGAAAPQVEAPLGAFFGGHRKVFKDSYAALLLGYSPSAMYCYFPMPFWRSATIEVQNRGREDISLLRAEVRYKPAAARPYPERECGHFYAAYHKEFPRTEGHDYTYLDWRGRGHIVGHTTARYDTSMEEDERTYFDGNSSPQIHGNGFEDDHNMGWGLKNRQHPVFGAIAADGGAGSIYRLFLPDLYYFQSAVKHGHQTYGPHSPVGHEGFYQVGNEESVVFFYGKKAAGIALSDEVDVGDTDSERSHSYRVRGSRADLTGRYWYDGEFNNVLFPTPPVADNGVSFTGSSEFSVKIDPNNHGVRLRRRLDKNVNRQKAIVFVDGRRVAERPWHTVDHDKTYRDIRWVDSDFEIPAKYTSGKGRITLRIENANGPGRPWNEFHYWVFSDKE